MLLMALQYLVPLLVLMFTYTRIALVVWGKRTPGEAHNIRDQRMAVAKRKVSRGVSEELKGAESQRSARSLL